MRWSPPGLARAPNAAEIEWAFLECSRQLSSGGEDAETRRDREARMAELERLLAQDPDPLHTRYHAALVEEMRRRENA